MSNFDDFFFANSLIVRREIATGGVSIGDTVAVDEDDKVQKITGTFTEENVGAKVDFIDADTSGAGIAFNTNVFNSNQVLVCFQEVGGSNIGSMVVGIIGASTVTWSAKVVFNADNSSAIAVSFDAAADRYIVMYRDQGESKTSAQIITVVANIPSAGAAFTIAAQESTQNTITYDPVEEKHIIAYRGSGNVPEVNVARISGTSILFGVDQNLIGAVAVDTDFDSVYDPDEARFYVTLTITGNSTGAAIVEISGNNPVIVASFINVETNASSKGRITYDTKNKVALMCYNDDNNNNLVAVTLVAQTSNFAVGNKGVVDGITPTSKSLIYDAQNEIATLFYTDEGTSGVMKVAIIENVNIVGSATVFFSNIITRGTISGISTFLAAVDNGIAQMVIVRQDAATSSGISSVWQNDTLGVDNVLTETNFLGIALESIGVGNPVRVAIDGFVDSSQTGLTEGETYYVQHDGSIDLQKTQNFANPISVGTSLSDTEILIRTGL